MPQGAQAKGGGWEISMYPTLQADVAFVNLGHVAGRPGNVHALSVELEMDDDSQIKVTWTNNLSTIRARGPVDLWLSDTDETVPTYLDLTIKPVGDLVRTVTIFDGEVDGDSYQQKLVQLSRANLRAKGSLGWLSASHLRTTSSPARRTR